MTQDITLDFIHLCDHASPGLHGKLTLVGIFETFFRTSGLDFYIATKINAKIKKKYKIAFEIQSVKDNKKIFIDKEPVEIPENVPVLTFQILKCMKGVDFKNAGKYKIIILVNDLPVGFKEFDVQVSENKTN